MLIKKQQYPMKSAIQRNLGGPLSEVFFSCLSPSQQDHIGYTPKLQGPGKDLWVSPSDILMGKVILSPPFTSRLRQALTHRGILALGHEIETKFIKKYELILQTALEKKHMEMRVEVDQLIKEAVRADRQAQDLIHGQILEKASIDLTNTYQEILAESVAGVLAEGMRRLEEAVEKTIKDMEQELCNALNARSEHLGKQFEFQLAYRENELMEKYANKLKSHRQNCVEAMEKLQKESTVNMKRVVAQLEAQHITDLLIQACERSKNYHREKNNLENNFGDWFMRYFEGEIVKRDFSVIELEETVRMMEAKCDRRENQLREVFKHFQRFINFALKEKPGQAEFLLSLEKELKQHQQEDSSDTEVEFLARVIIEYMIMLVSQNFKDNKAIGHEDQIKEIYTRENFRGEIKKEREKARMLRLFGEENLSTLTEAKFRQNQIMSLVGMFEKSPSIRPMLDRISKPNEIYSS